MKYLYKTVFSCLLVASFTLLQLSCFAQHSTSLEYACSAGVCGAAAWLLGLCFLAGIE